MRRLTEIFRDVFMRDDMVLTPGPDREGRARAGTASSRSRSSSRPRSASASSSTRANSTACRTSAIWPASSPPRRPPPEHTVGPVLGRLRPCRQRRGHVSAATAGRRGLGDQHRPVLQPPRLRRVDRRCVQRRLGPRAGRRRGGARRAGALRRRAVRLHGRSGDRRSHPGCGHPHSCRKSRRGLLLRPGDRRRGRGLCPARYSRTDPRPGPAACRHRDAEPLRA